MCGHETELVNVKFRAGGCRVDEGSTTSGLRANWMFGSCRWMIGSRQSPRPRPLSLGEAGAPVRSNPGREGGRVNVRARRLFDVQSTGPQVLQMKAGLPPPPPAANLCTPGDSLFGGREGLGVAPVTIFRCGRGPMTIDRCRASRFGASPTRAGRRGMAFEGWTRDGICNCRVADGAGTGGEFRPSACSKPRQGGRKRQRSVMRWRDGRSAPSPARRRRTEYVYLCREVSEWAAGTWPQASGPCGERID